MAIDDQKILPESFFFFIASSPYDTIVPHFIKDVSLYRS
jgi:hypothetical protein